MGLKRFFWCIAIPSIFEWGTKDYYDKPWEVMADVYGGATQFHTSEILKGGIDYEKLSRIAGPLAWLTID